MLWKSLTGTSRLNPNPLQGSLELGSAANNGGAQYANQEILMRNGRSFVNIIDRNMLDEQPTDVVEVAGSKSQYCSVELAFVSTS
jgi:hypothetical protein